MGSVSDQYNSIRSGAQQLTKLHPWYTFNPLILEEKILKRKFPIFLEVNSAPSNIQGWAGNCPEAAM
jgi:hypothetical protein